jgi:hypothetical protein
MTNASQADPHAADSTVGPHGTADHGGDHGDDHGHDDQAHGDGDALGPVNVTAWAIGAVGIIAGLIVAAALAASTGRFG